MKHTFFTIVMIAMLVGCQAVPNLTYTPVTQEPTTTFIPINTPTIIPNTSSPTVQPSLHPLTIDWTIPFSDPSSGEIPTLATWNQGTYTGKDFSLPLDLNRVANPRTLDGLTTAQKNFLIQNGFVIIHSQEAQFGDIRAETSRETGQPYYLTTDAAFHAFHLQFDALLKELERDHFRPQITAIIQASLHELKNAIPLMADPSLQLESQQALEYLSVAAKLFDPATDIDPTVADAVAKQVNQIIAAQGRGKSVIFPDFEDDYGAYKPVGHYAGDPDLEAYFRGMTWLGRVHFRLQDPENPEFVSSRVPLIVTLALRKAQINDHPASDDWADMHKTLTFVIGPSDDAGPLEYSALMDQVFGNQATYQDLSDETLWQKFLDLSDQLPTPQINSLFVTSTLDLSGEKGWRFMGQRFTLDGQILQNVIFDRVQAKSDGTKRELPSGMDVMAALGSSLALEELEQQGVTDFPNYPEQMAKMRQSIIAQPESQWLGRFYDGWLYSFLPVIQPKDSSFPAYMQTRVWGYKDINAALGSWAELKHDTSLYIKMPDMAGGGGPPMSGPAPSYVEPNPAAFYQMAYMAQMLSCGLQNRVMKQPCSHSKSLFSFGYNDLDGLIQGMTTMGARFKALGDIAVKELSGQTLTEDDVHIITSCFGSLECWSLEGNNIRPQSEMPKAPIIAAVSGTTNNVLEVGVGNVNRIYVVVPLEDKWEVAQGGVFSYYEFSQPRNQRITDDEWRERLAKGAARLPDWASSFVLSGGKPLKILFFRVGDVYIITEPGNDLNVREQPSVNGTVIGQMKTNDYVEIIDGPVIADGYTWWKFIYIGGEGWAVEHQEWYVRSYLP